MMTLADIETSIETKGSHYRAIVTANGRIIGQSAWLGRTGANRWLVLYLSALI